MLSFGSLEDINTARRAMTDGVPLTRRPQTLLVATNARHWPLFESSDFP